MSAAWMGAAWLAVGSFLAAVGYAAFRPLWMWKLRSLPGPSALPFLGNIPNILSASNATEWIAEQAQKYCGVFKFWQGGAPYVVVKDAALARKILLSCSSRPGLEFLTCLVGDLHKMQHVGLLDMSLAEHGNKFRLMRKAFEAALLSPAALAVHGSMLAGCASRLAAFFGRYASTGEPLDVTQPLSDMTMEAIGWAAFGLEFNCLGGDGGKAAPAVNSKAAKAWYDAEPGSAEFASGLVQASRLIVKYYDVSQSTPWKLPGLMVPAIGGLVRVIANWFPDALLQDDRQARSGVMKALKKLIAEWKRHKEAGGAAGGAPLPAISESGFLASMLNSVGGEVGVKEIDIMAQTQLMVLAGYETTATSLAVCMHLLATHPEAQAHAARELEEVLAGKAAMPGDVEKLPYLSAVFDEALRLLSPADAAARKMVTSDGRGYDLGDGRVIPENAFVWLSLHALQRDPAIWPRATKFLPERHMQPGNESLAPANAHGLMPFGYGARMCPGYKFSQMEARLTLARVLQAYTLKPAPGCPPPVWKSGIVYTPNAVWLSIAPRTKTA